MQNLWWLMLLVATSVASGAGPRIEIILGESPPQLVQRAADELAADLKRVYNADVQIGGTVPGPEKHVILLGATDSGAHLQGLSEPLPKLSEQGHAVISRKCMDRPVLVVAGGSPTATYWAAAELAHRLGVRTMLYGDVDPVAPPAFSVEGYDIVLHPRAEHRAWQMDFDSPIGPAVWGLADQRKLLRQLARLKFNQITFSASAPTPADAVAAFRRIGVSGDTGGRSAFRGAKFFENPDLASAPTDEARRKATQELIRGIEAEAKALGMTIEVLRNSSTVPRLPSSELLPLLSVTKASEQLGAVLRSKPHVVGIQAVSVGDADLTAFLHSRGCFDAKLGAMHPLHDLVTPICGEGVSDRVLKAFTLGEEAAKLVISGDEVFGAPLPDVVMKHYASTDPPPEQWSKAREDYLGAMNEMYRANTRAREGSRSYTLYFARRFEFAFEYMNCLTAVRQAGIAKSKQDTATQVAELEKAVESLSGGLNALAAVARSPSDRGIIAVLNEHGYRPLVKELETASEAADSP
jgi:hypothetical protein